MVIFINEDRSYLNWVTHHRQGYVLDGFRKPKISRLVVHRASCSDVKSSAGHKRAHWTTGRKLKACSDHLQELQDWSAEEIYVDASFCVTCQPDKEVASESNSHLSKLSAEILDYVLDAALIHMEHEYPPYQLTANDISACFGKTLGQISPVLRKLIDSGFLFIPGRIGTASLIPAKRIVLPTMLAMRTLEAFQQESDVTIQSELDKLRPEQ